MTFMPIGQTALTQVDESLRGAGDRHGETVAVTKPQNSSGIAEWLATKGPDDIDRAAELRAQQHGVTLKVKYQGRYPSGPNGEKLPSYMVAVGCGIHGIQASRDAAIADLQKFETPATVRNIEIWLAELSVITAGRGRDGVEAELALTAYSSRLSNYPADVARYAILGKTWKWFPTWAELESVCEAKAGPRRHMIAALRQPEPDPEPTYRRPTQEERNRIAALVADQFPNVPQGWRDRAVDEATKGECMNDAANIGVKRMEGE